MAEARARLFGAVAVLVQQRNVMLELEAAGAVSPETAVTLQTVKMTSELDLKWLVYFVKQGLIGKTEDWRIWWNRK